MLQMEALQGMWTAMYNSPPWGLTRFNNTVVLGSLVLGAIFSVAAFPLLIWAVKSYREQFLARLSKFKLVQVVMGSRWGSRLYGFYDKLVQLGFV